MDSWASYYRLRGLPPESPAALLLDVALTLHAAVARLQQQLSMLHHEREAAQGRPVSAAWQQQQQQQRNMRLEEPNGDAGTEHGHLQPGTEGWQVASPPAGALPALPQPLVLHLLGPQRELDAWPLLLELGCLLPPGQRVELHLIGPEVPPWAHARGLHVPQPAEGPCGRPGCSCAEAEGLRSAGAAHPACQAGTAAAAGCAGVPAAQRQKQEQQQQERQGPLEAGSQACRQQGSNADGPAESQTLFFWRGEWHELAAGLAQRHGAPHAVVAPNAGKQGTFLCHHARYQVSLPCR